MSPNTVRKYVAALASKGLITTEPTNIRTKDGRKHNGSLLYTIRPIQEAINRFTTAEIKVDMSGMSNTVHNTNDLDGIVDGLTTRVLQAMEVVRDGA